LREAALALQTGPGRDFDTVCEETLVLGVVLQRGEPVPTYVVSDLLDRLPLPGRHVGADIFIDDL